MAARKAEINGKRPFRVKEYTFSHDDVPRLSCTDPEVERLIANEVIFAFCIFRSLK